jgi:uncharacterized protein (TIGR02271 family)
MSTLSDRTLTAMFDTREAADDAARRLEQIGVPSGFITITGGPAHEEQGFWEKLFFPADDREAYAEGIRRGGYLLTVTGLDADLYDRAAVVLEEHEGTVDLDERTEAWRQAGWKNETGAKGAATDEQGLTADARLGAAHRATGETVIPVIEERLKVGKREAVTGRTRVRSYVTERPVEEGVTLREQHVVVEQRTLDRPATAADLTAARDQTIEAASTAEEVVVAKTAHVVGEVVVKTGETERTETVQDTVKKTEVEVDDDATRSINQAKPRAPSE